MNQYIECDCTKKYKEQVEGILEERKKEILSFFEVEDYGQFSFSVYIYGTQEKLKQELKKRGFKQDPDYMCACFKDKDQSINLFEPKDNPSPNEWTKKEYEKVIFHEEIHAIQYIIYKKQPEWLTEGVAKYLDGTYQKGIKWLLENYINEKKVPSMKEIEEEFGWHDYDSYDYAYLMVCYLIETLGKNIFLQKIADPEALEKISDHLVEKVVTYYQKKYC